MNYLFTILIVNRSNENSKIELAAQTSLCRLVCVEDNNDIAVLLFNSRFDLIFFDEKLVNQDLLGLIQTYQPDVPLIVLIEGEDINARKRLIASGFDDCIEQPLTAVKLNETVNLWLREDELAAVLASVRMLLAKLNNNRDLVAALWQSLLAELPNQIVELSAALNHRDYSSAYEIIHKLNGSAKVCSLKEIEPIATCLEKNLLDRNYDLIEDDFNQLKAKVLKLVEWRDSILKEIRGETSTVK